MGDALSATPASQDGSGQVGLVQGRPAAARRPVRFLGRQPLKHVRLPGTLLLPHSPHSDFIDCIVRRHCLGRSFQDGQQRQQNVMHET